MTPEPTPWARWRQIGLGAMGMTEAEFFAQSFIVWRDRLDGFVELHGGGGKDAPGEPFTEDDFEALIERIEEERAQSAPEAPALRMS